MARLSIYNYLKQESYCTPVNLFNDAAQQTTENSKNFTDLSSKGTHSDTGVSYIIDSESCLDRLYGGYYSDWASGGQWNRMLSYISNLSKACSTNNVKITVSMRGGVEKEHAESLFRANRDFKDRLNRMMLHLQNRGTPPPKVWWLPPTCLREVICLALQVNGVAVLSTSGDYYTDVMTHLYLHNMDGILTDDPGFALLNPPRLFAAHDFKLTYKGSLETKEYFLQKMFAGLQLVPERLALFGSLLGNHIITRESLREFHLELAGENSSRSMEEADIATISKLLDFVKEFPDPKNIDTIGNIVFRSSITSVENGIENLRRSMEYYEYFAVNHKGVSPAVVKTGLDILPMRSDGRHRKKNAVVDENFEADEVVDQEELKASNDNSADEPSDKHKSAKESITDQTAEGSEEERLMEQVAELTVNGDIQKSGAAKLHVDICPSDAILKLAKDRHSKGLMSPIIIQSLIQREVRLPCYIESSLAGEDNQSIVEMYRPIRQSIYAILHNLNKHLYDTRKIAESQGNTVSADDIAINVAEHYLGPLGAEVQHDIRVKPVPWPVPSVESLWLGVKPENKLRRMKAFLSTMQVGSNPLMMNPAHVPERFLLICCVLRYLLKCEPTELAPYEVDAALAMATAPILFDIQTMQDMQLPVITPRGAHIASVLMGGVQHALLVNDTCGAPIRTQCCFPWLYMDGKLLQYKLLKASSSMHVSRLDLCDGQMAQVIIVEQLRQAVWHGLEHRLADKPTSFPYTLAAAGLPGAHMFTAPAAFLRPNISSAGRGKGSLMGEFKPARLDDRGGKLQVAGQVVATWGPRPGTSRDRYNHRLGDYNGAPANENNGASYASGSYRQKKKQGYQQNRHNQSENKNKNQNAKSNHSEARSAKQVRGAKSVTIATKDEKAQENGAAVTAADNTEPITKSAVTDNVPADEHLVNGEEPINKSTDSGIAADTVTTRSNITETVEVGRPVPGPVDKTLVSSAHNTTTLQTHSLPKDKTVF